MAFCKKCLKEIGWTKNDDNKWVPLDRFTGEVHLQTCKPKPELVAKYKEEFKKKDPPLQIGENEFI